MKVALFVISPEYGGAETMSVDLAIGLQRRGIDVEVWTIGDTWLDASAAGRGLPVLRLHKRWIRNPLLWPLVALRLMRQIRTRHIDVVHGHFLGAGVFSSLVAQLMGAAAVITLHDEYSVRKPGVLLSLLGWVEKRGARVVAVSRSISAAVSEAGWCKDLVTIHNGVDATEFPRRGSVVARAGLNFICVTRLVPLKNVDVLIRAAAEISSARTFRITIVGDGPEETRLRGLVDLLALQDRIRFLGFRNGIPELLAQADCFLLASSTEGLSYGILEAMACSLPVVASYVGGNPELVEHEETGLLLESGNVAAWRDAMTFVIENDEWRVRAGQAARRRVEDHFPQVAMVDGYLQLYGSTISDPK